VIFGIGIDIVEISRMKEAVDRWGDSLLSKIFTKREIRYSSARRLSSQHFAARFAAKEAVIKAFGEPLKHPMNWTDIEVLNDAEGKPVIVFHGRALKLKRKKSVKEVIVSLSHSKDYAVANAMLLKR
jgi:holo-[acyl-carrier protein] synthase